MSKSYTNCPYCMKEVGFYEDMQPDGSFHIICPYCKEPFGIVVSAPAEVVNHISQIEEYDQIDPNSISPEDAQLILDALDPSTPNTAPVDSDPVIKAE